MLTERQLQQRREAGKARARAFSPEHQRRAGEALKEQVDPGYYEFIGRRGGRKLKLKEIQGWLENETDPECREALEARAADYTDHGHGTRMLPGLWQPGQAPAKASQVRQIGPKALKRWEKMQRQEAKAAGKKKSRKGRMDSSNDGRTS